MYINIKSLCCIPKTNTMSHVNYISFLKTYFLSLLTLGLMCCPFQVLKVEVEVIDLKFFFFSNRLKCYKSPLASRFSGTNFTCHAFIFIRFKLFSKFPFEFFFDLWAI